MKKLKEEKR